MKNKYINKRLDALEHNVVYLEEENIKNKARIECKQNYEEKRFRTIQRTVSRLNDNIQEKDLEIERLKDVISTHIKFEEVK